MFSGEWKGADYRKRMNLNANKEEYQYNIRNLILDEMEAYRAINPDALACKNGDRVVRPDEIWEKDLKIKLQKNGDLKEKEWKMLKDIEAKKLNI